VDNSFRRAVNSLCSNHFFIWLLTAWEKHTGQRSGILCAAIVGGAILPVVQGFFADRIGIQTAFFIPVLCYCLYCFLWLEGPQDNDLKSIHEVHLILILQLSQGFLIATRHTPIL